MQIYQKDGITVQSFLDTRRKLISGLCRVRIRVIYQRKVWEYSTGKQISKSDWETLPASKKPYLREIRADIQSSFDLIKKTVQELVESGMFSFTLLNYRFKHAAETTLNCGFKSKAAELEAESRIGSQHY